MATYHVAKTGNDTTGDGSLGNPYLTIDKGISVLVGSDILIIHAGTYVEAIRFATRAIPSGSSGNPTIIRAADGETVIVMPNDGDQFVVITNVSRSWITFRDLIFDASNVINAVCRVTNTSQHIWFEGCELRNSADSHGLIVAPAVDETDEGNIDCRAINCNIHDCGNEWVGPISPPHGIYPQSDGMIVEGCEIYNCGNGYGIHHFSGGSNHIYRNNYIHDNDSGILEGSDGSSGTQIYNNIVAFNGLGIKVATAGSLSDAEIYNNTIWLNDGGIFVGNEGGSETGIIIQNNILYPVSGAADGSLFLASSSSSCVATNNILRQAATNQGTGNTVNTNTLTDPLLTNPAGGDFSLQSGSPARDVGLDLSGQGFSTDKDGVSRPQGSAWDIGALEFVVASNPGYILRGSWLIS